MQNSAFGVTNYYLEGRSEREKTNHTSVATFPVNGEIHGNYLFILFKPNDGGNRVCHLKEVYHEV